MKPLQIALLVVAGALTGAVMMRVLQRPRLETTAVTPAAPAVEQPEPAPASATATPVPQPEPAVEMAPIRQKPIAKEKPSAPPRRPVRAAKKPAIVATIEPAPAAAPSVPMPPQELPKPPEQAIENLVPAPPPNPPARTEPEQVTPPPPPPPEPHRVTLNAGLLIPVRLIDGLSSERNAPGDAFLATLERELVADGFVIAERGARVEGRVVASDRGGKMSGAASLAVQLTGIQTSDGQKVAIQTDPFARHAESDHRQNAERIGGGAVAGAMIGGMAGGGKGAAIGAGAGGGAGAGSVLLTRGRPATLPSETRLSFRLKAPVTITEKIY